MWPEFSQELTDLTGIDIGYEHEGGFYLCMSETDWNARKQTMETQFDSDLPVAGAYEMMERGVLDRAIPGLGNAVVGGCFCKLDGAVNPMTFYRALHAGFENRSGKYVANSRVRHVDADGDGFRISTDRETYVSGKLVLAAGLGNANLGKLVGIDMPVRPCAGRLWSPRNYLRYCDTQRIPFDRWVPAASSSAIRGKR